MILDNILSDSDKAGLSTKAMITPSADNLFDFDNFLKKNNHTSLNIHNVNS